MTTSVSSEAASSSEGQTSSDGRISSAADASFASDELAPDPWLLKLLLTGSDRRFWKIGSFVIGLLGVTTFAISAAAAAGVYIAWATQWNFRSTDHLLTTSARVLAYLPLAGAYVAVLFSLQLIGTCRLPITVRLLLVYGTLYISIAAVLGNFELPVDSIYVLAATPFCLGGFLQRRYGGWNAVCWNQQTEEAKPLTVATLLDATAAIALTMCMIKLGHRSVPAAGYFCFVPTALLCAVVGMHGWARLMSICHDSSDIASGFALWMAGNISLGCLIWLGMTLMLKSPPDGVVGFLGAILVVIVAHWWTEVPVRWLRACGWKLTRQSSL